MMNVCEPVKAVFLDDNAAQECQRLFNQYSKDAVVRLQDPPIEIRAYSDPDEFLMKLTRGELHGYSLLLDVNFSDMPGSVRALRMTDTLNDLRRYWGEDVLRTVKRIDPDFPVIVLSALGDRALPFEAGHYGADDFIRKDEITPRELHSRILQAVAQCRQRSVYDHEHLVAADAFAPVYDQEEQKKCATIAYYHFENELIREIVSRMAKELSKRARRRIAILDLGCGTGRIEECLARMDCRGQLDVAAVDFSGGMLGQAHQKLAGLPDRCDVAFGYPLEHQDDGKLHVSLYRAPAENIHAMKARYPNGFDLAILGFGFLSYVRSWQVLPFAVQVRPTTGLWPLLREEGRLLFSVYNEHSIVYQVMKSSLSRDYSQDCPIAAIMELEAGRLRVGENRYFECEAFTPARMMRFLNQAGFDVEESQIKTFPTLHLALKNTQSGTFTPHPEFPYGRFDVNLYEYDRRLSMMFSDRGHYLLGVAVKRSAQGMGAWPA